MRLKVNSSILSKVETVRRKQANEQTHNCELIHTQNKRKCWRTNSPWALGVTTDKEQRYSHGNTAVHMEEVIDWQS